MNSSKAQVAPEAAAAAAAQQEDEQEILLAERLMFIPYPRTVPLSGKKELYWPALRYNNLNEAAHLDFHSQFQCRVGEALLDMVLEGLPQDDASPICRLLGFDDGTFAKDVQEENMLFPFVKHIGTKVVNDKTKDQFFDLTQEHEQKLYQLYQKAFQEARSILRGGRTVSLLGQHQNQPKKQKTTQDHHNGGGGGGGGNDGKPDEDSSKPFAARLEAAAPAVLPEAIPAQQPLAPIPQNNAPVQQQEEAAKPAAKEQEVAAAAVAVTASAPEPTKDENQPPPPGTPPFHSNAAPLEPTEPWNNVWNKLRRAGWNRRTSQDSVDGYIFTKPEKNTFDGVEGVDYFTSIRDVQRYVQSKAPQWQPPIPIDDDDNGAVAAAAAAAPQARAQEDVDHVRGISSAATVVTAGSMSPPMTAKPFNRSRRATRPAPVANLGPDRLWWQDKKGRKGKSVVIPTLNNVKDVLAEKLGIRQDEDGVFHLPERINDKEETPELETVDALRKYLCTKGIPTVKGESLLDKDEQELLHKWVSFAYVPRVSNPKTIASTTLPADEKLIALLLKLKFEKCDMSFFPPKVDHCGVQRDMRIPGVHFFRGLAEVRDYVRRTASFTWTADELELKEDDDEDEFAAIDRDEELMIRLWAASSPSPLVTYETSIDEMNHLERRFPLNQNYIEDYDSPAEEESVEEMSCASPASASSSDESAESDAEMSASSEQEDSPVPARKAVKATGKRVRELEQPKAKSTTTRNSRNNKKAKKNQPWWQATPVPSFEIVRPIIKKLGIIQDANGIFHLPGKDENNELSDPESLRKALCSEGIPRFTGSKKPNLSEKQSELLRRWVSFAFVPVTPENSVEELQNVAPVYDKHLTKELHAVQFLGKFGFQRNTEGEGYFPPGIDSLGRKSSIRKMHLKISFVEVREYIRCAEKLVLSRPKEEEDSDSDSEDDEHDPMEVLALRLWGALEPSPLRTYNVSADSDTVPGLDDQVETPVTKKGKKKSNKSTPEEVDDLDVELEYPDWWMAKDEDDLAKIIEDLKLAEEKQRANSGRRRGQEPPHMTWQQLELACQVRSKMESIAIASPRKGVDPETVTLQGQVDELANAWGHSQGRLQAFLTGDEKKLHRQAVHSELEDRFRSYVDGDAKPPSAKKSSKKKEKAASKVEAVEHASEISVASPASVQLSSERDDNSKGNESPTRDSKEPAEAKDDELQEITDSLEKNEAVEGSPAAADSPQPSDAMEVDEPVVDMKNSNASAVVENQSEESKGGQSPVMNGTTEGAKNDTAAAAQISDNVATDSKVAMEVDDFAVEPTGITEIGSSKVNGKEVAGDHTIPLKDVGPAAENDLEESRHPYYSPVRSGPGASSKRICFDDESSYGKANPRRVTDHRAAADNEDDDEFLKRPGLEEYCYSGSSPGDNEENLENNADYSGFVPLTQPGSP